MLACARIGAVHSVVFGGFSPDSLAGRILDCDSRIVITADEGVRGGKPVPLKKNTDDALAKTPGVTDVIVVRRTGGAIAMKARSRPLVSRGSSQGRFRLSGGRDGRRRPAFYSLYLRLDRESPRACCTPTSGCLLWCALDPSLCVRLSRWRDLLVHRRCRLGNRALLYSLWPAGERRHQSDVRRRAQLPDQFAFLGGDLDKHKVNIFYTAPTAIRALDARGRRTDHKTSRASLRLLGSVGEPINPEAWQWYHRVVGDGRCPIVDTWWQTETGGILILRHCRAPLRPKAWLCYPAPAFFWHRTPAIVDADGSYGCCGSDTGNLFIARSLGPARCVRSMAITSASSIPISKPTRANISSPATAAAAILTATTGSPAGSTT